MFKDLPKGQTHWMCDKHLKELGKINYGCCCCNPHEGCGGKIKKKPLKRSVKEGTI